jgi:hypothetical protein
MQLVQRSATTHVAATTNADSERARDVVGYNLHVTFISSPGFVKLVSVELDWLPHGLIVVQDRRGGSGERIILSFLR